MSADPAPPSHPPPADSGHRFDAGRRWEARLALAFDRRETAHAGRTRLTRAHHSGPLRVQRPFYPEPLQPALVEPCHVYLLHPPGGLVSGDALALEIAVEADAHALLTTPAATKLYRADSQGVTWQQRNHLQVDAGGLLEWLPQETIAFDGSRGAQSTTVELTGDARCLGWEVMALGRPVGALPFVSGAIEQRFRLTRDGRPLWLERQPLDPHHARFQGRWGQGGASVQATLWAAGLAAPEVAVAALREALPAAPQWAVTQRLGVLLLRYLGDSRNQAWDYCQAAWHTLRPLLAEREACEPRIWRT
ncbi:urease accessory protein UreD [Salinicola endophyticus]|uniref:Urease accessory protein UreD n=1 Tax=Salinicola endophyticus TaxID=1949083 RepID=A0AB74UBD2_9GAMM